jgi:hypothetical protein
VSKTATRPDLWREPEALGYEGQAATIAEAERGVDDVLQLLRFHEELTGAGALTNELRSVLGRLRSLRSDLQTKADVLRAQVTDRQHG